MVSSYQRKAKRMRTDNEFHDPYLSSGWSASADSANIIQTASQGWFWAEPWSRWEREAEADLIAGRYEAFNTDSAFLASLGEPRRYVQLVLLFLPLALWRWLRRLHRK
jgi:hypothetical protein